MIVAGACKIVLLDNELSQRFVEPLGQNLKRWIELVDPKQISYQRARAVLSPIACEIGIQLPEKDHGVLNVESKQRLQEP